MHVAFIIRSGESNNDKVQNRKKNSDNEFILISQIYFKYIFIAT